MSDENAIKELERRLERQQAEIDELRRRLDSTGERTEASGYYFAGGKAHVLVVDFPWSAGYVQGVNVFPLQDHYRLLYVERCGHGAGPGAIKTVKTLDFRYYTDEKTILQGDTLGYPQAGFMGNGRLGAVTFFDRKIAFLSSDDGGETWAAPVMLPEPPSGARPIMPKGPVAWPARAGGADGSGWIFSSHADSGLKDVGLPSRASPSGPSQYYLTRDNGRSWQVKERDQGSHLEWLACEQSIAYIGKGRYVMAYRINYPGHPFGLAVSSDAFATIDGVYGVGAEMTPFKGLDFLQEGSGKNPRELFYDGETGRLHLVAVVRSLNLKEGYIRYDTVLETYADAEAVWADPSNRRHWAPWQVVYRHIGHYGGAKRGVNGLPAGGWSGAESAMEANTTPPFKMPDGTWAMSFGDGAGREKSFCRPALLMRRGTLDRVSRSAKVEISSEPFRLWERVVDDKGPDVYE